MNGSRDGKVEHQVLDSYRGPDAMLLGLGESEARRALTAAVRGRLEVLQGVARALSRLADSMLVAERFVTQQRLGTGRRQKDIIV